MALGDLRRCDELHAQLVPFGERHLAIQTIVTAGSGARFLGLLAAALDRPDEAEARFEAAIGVEERLCAAPFEALARRDLAVLLERRGKRAAARAQREAAEKLGRGLGLAGF